MQNPKKVQNCANALSALLPRDFSPAAGLVLGTGLGGLGDILDAPVWVPFEQLPGFPLSTVQSHAGAFVAGRLSGVPVLLQQGRCHLYEGKSPQEVVMGVRVMAELGIPRLVITNAAGALNPHFDEGSLMVIDDHLNFSGHSPLTGPNEDTWGVRFPDISRAYDQDLMRILEARALAEGIRLEKGVYVCTHGPELETRAETRAFRALGADAVGMSTVLEVIAARHRGMRVLGISCLTNKNLPDCMEAASIESIIAVAEKAGADLKRLLATAMPELAVG